MTSVLASEDQSMSDAAAGNGKNVGVNPDETFVDFSDQRVRVVRMD